MTLADYALFAEIAGSIAIFLTLVFVGIQLRSANRETRAATMQAAMDSEMTLISVLTENAGTWEKVITGAHIELGEESRKSILLFNLLMVDTENRYQQFKAGYFDDQSWAARREILKTLVVLPIFALWRGAPGAKTRSAEFLGILDQLRSAASTVPDAE